MKTIKVTTKQFQGVLGFNHQVEANAVMKLLVNAGVVKKVGSLKPTKSDGTPKQGKPSAIYEVPQKVTIKLFESGEVPNQVEVATSTKKKTEEA